MTFFGADGDNHRSYLFGHSSWSGLVKIRRRTDLHCVLVEDGLLHEGKQLIVVVWDDIGWDLVNCQQYSSWREGKG